MQNELETLKAENARLRAEVTRLMGEKTKIGVMQSEFKDIVDNSLGVVGYHRNGDIATWEWLIENDYFPVLNDWS